MRDDGGTLSTDYPYTSRVPLFYGLWALLALLCGLLIALKVEHRLLPPLPVLALGLYAVFTFACEYQGVVVKDDRMSFPFRPFRLFPLIVLGRTHLTVSELRRVISLPSVFGIARLYVRTSANGYLGLCFPSREAKHDLQNLIHASNASCETMRLQRSSQILHY